MLAYTLRRLNLFIITLLLLGLVAFSLTHLVPGDPLLHLVAIDGLNQMEVTELSRHYHLHQSYPVQFYHYLGRVLDGDLGLSLATGQPVADDLLKAAPATLELALYAMAVALLIGIPAGTLAAMYKRSATDYAVQSLALLGYSIPIYWWALLLAMLFSLQLGWLPISGRLSLLYEIPRVTGLLLVDILLYDSPLRAAALGDALRHLLLPTLVLATVPTTVVTRLMRSALSEVLKQNYIRAAKARGWPLWKVVWRHGMRNALLPVGQQVGLQFSALLTGAMITESIFNWPGLGNYLINAIYARDYPAIQGGLLLLSAFVILVSVLNDLIFMALDPLKRKRLYAQA
ncbi:ABC transporter permease [Gallaecimonas sp. GXIMD4217]|uniref:ABC transporter permease n=1 Tax=Gallaecimonas sp. GXIMD4217 TaxID=3131927 RepID=UPI00311B3AEB